MLDLIFFWSLSRRIAKGQDEGYNYILAPHIDPLGIGTIQARMYHVFKLHVAVVESDSPSDIVYGDLYRMRNPEKLLYRYDQLVGFEPNANKQGRYIRKMVQVKLDAQRYEAWTYINTRDPIQAGWDRVESGDFSEVLHSFGDRRPSVLPTSPTLEIPITDLVFVWGLSRRIAAPYDDAFRIHIAPYTNFLGGATMQGRMYKIFKNHVAVVESGNPSDVVHGELYRMHEPEKLLYRYDQFVGYDPNSETPTRFTRKLIQVTHNDRIRNAWVWLHTRDPVAVGWERVPSGDFADVLGSNEG